MRAIIDEYTDDSVIIPESEVADIEAKAIRFIDMAQKELFRIGNIYKTYQITRKPPTNGLGQSFYMNAYEGTDVTTQPVVAKHYHFEVDSDATVVIEEYEGDSWLTLTSLVVTPTEMTAYKGDITPTTHGNQIRLRFTGTYAYNYTNVALFPVNYKVSPDYKPWVSYEMPSDFAAVSEIVQEINGRYELNGTYQWESFKTLLVSYDFEGEIRVIYNPVPTTISLRTQSLEVDDITANAITYYVVSKIAPHEMAELVNTSEQKYQELKHGFNARSQATETTITNVYGDYYV